MAWGGEKPEPGREHPPGAGRGEGRPSRAAGSRVSGKARDLRALIHSFPLLDPLPLGLSTASEKGKDGPGLRRVSQDTGSEAGAWKQARGSDAVGSRGRRGAPLERECRGAAACSPGVPSTCARDHPVRTAAMAPTRAGVHPAAGALGGVPVVGRGRGYLSQGVGRGQTP